MMHSAQRRFGSICRHVQPPEATFVHGINTSLAQGLRRGLESMSSPVIVGGMVLDILAKPETATKQGTTTPGRVLYVPGGVARNVGECMSKLGSKPFMVSVVGMDMAGDLLLKLWESAGLSTEGVLKLKNVATPVVSNIFDCKGELAAAVAHVHVVENFLSPDWIQKFRHRIYSASILIVDANLHPQSLEAACQLAAESGTPTWFEPVSVIKSARIASVVNHITCVSPNVNELIAMAKALSSEQNPYSFEQNLIFENQFRSTQSFFDALRPAILLLLSSGIELVVVTLGSRGVFLCFKGNADFMRDRIKEKESTYQSRLLYELMNHLWPSQRLPASHAHAFHLPALNASVVSLVGAGDCLVGGIIASLCCGLDVMQSTAVGISIAKAAVEDDGNVPAELEVSSIASEAQQVLSAAKRLVLDWHL